MEIDDFQKDIGFIDEKKDFLQKNPVIAKIHSAGDKVIVMTGEGTKAFVRECYHLSNQLVNLWCGMVVEFVTPSTFNDSRRSRFVQAKNIPPIENSEVNELQSIQQLLNSEDSYPELFSEPSALEPPQTVPSMKKDYNTRSLPTKLIKKRCEQPKPKQPRRWWLYPLYLLYPILVHFFQLYTYLWSQLLPNYKSRQSESIRSISASTIPSDIDVNSEAISGLLEDLHVEMFRHIHRFFQRIRVFWLASLLPSTYWNACCRVASTLWEWIRHPFRRFRSRAPSLPKTATQRWEELEEQMNELVEDYFSTLEANRPPSIYDTQTQADETLGNQLLTKYLLGYPVEEYTVHTRDHYCIVLFRLPRPEAKRVVYLQHGVMDTALAWVSNEPSVSMAIQLYLQGYDVFFGSFRGTDGHYKSTRCRNEQYDVDTYDYWDYNIDDLILDYRSFIESIFVIKERERLTPQNNSDSSSSEFSICYKGHILPSDFEKLDETLLHQMYTVMSISHSMGGAVNLAYIVESIITHRAHHLSNCVLLSPAGYLNDQSAIMKLTMKLTSLIDLEKAKPVPFPTKSSKMHLFVAKLLQDMASTPATLDLVNQVCSSVIGGEPEDWPFQKVNYTRYPLGVTSRYVMCQFGQWYRADEFTSYNYGIEGNQKRYGQDTPIRYTDYYSSFDLPVHFLAGKHDTIVPSTQVFRHYTRLLPILGNRTSYVEFENAGHLQFTIGLDHDVISYVIDRLAQVPTEGYHGIKTEKKQPQCQFGFTKIDSSYNPYYYCLLNKTITIYPIMLISNVYFFFWKIFLW